MQRFFDLILSCLALLILSPLLILIVVLLRLTGEGEIFFLQERVGKHGKLFKIYKFATMLKNSPHIGTGTITLKGDPRVLPVGRFLRKTKINELPQLLNIVLGHMSIVGPRPLTSYGFNAFPKELQAVILQVKPGLSGIGSIIFRDEEKILISSDCSIDFYNNIIAPYKGQIESWYVQNQTLFTYFMVILMTIWVVLSPSSTIIWRFKELPMPPDNLKRMLKHSSVSS